jgi:hypothetical protein
MTAIEEDIGALSTLASGDEDKLQSLKFLGHWIGNNVDAYVCRIDRKASGRTVAG